MLKYMLEVKITFFFLVSTPSWGSCFSLFWFKISPVFPLEILS